MLDAEAVAKDQHAILAANGLSRMENAIERPSGRDEIQRTRYRVPSTPTAALSAFNFWHSKPPLDVGSTASVLSQRFVSKIEKLRIAASDGIAASAGLSALPAPATLAHVARHSSILLEPRLGDDNACDAS